VWLAVDSSDQVSTVLFIFVHRRKILVLLAIVFVVYLFNLSTEKMDEPLLVRDSVNLCEELDDYNDRWGEVRSFTAEKAQVLRLLGAHELQEKSLDESSIFQTPVAELVQAEFDRDTAVSVAIRRDLTRLCDQPDAGPLPPG
jgi:hypothetical protein